MSYDIENLYRLEPDCIFFAKVENGEIVVRAAYKGAAEKESFVITRLHWNGHLHEPDEPLHESVLDLIGRRMAGLVRDAYAHGYLKAQRDIRKSLGLS